MEIFESTFQLILDSEEMNGEYEIDYSKDPIWIDLAIDGEKIKCIMEFFNINSFRIAGDEERPDNFEGDADIIIFKRVFI